MSVLLPDAMFRLLLDLTDNDVTDGARFELREQLIHYLDAEARDRGFEQGILEARQGFEPGEEPRAPYPTQLSYRSGEFDAPANVRVNGRAVTGVKALTVQQVENEFSEVSLTLGGVQVTAEPKEPR